MCGSGRAISGDRPKRGHRVQSIPYHVEDNDPMVGAQEMRDHPRTHVTKAKETDCAHRILLMAGRLVIK
jgi:hypothetical protein